jgi:hypothetical protein
MKCGRFAWTFPLPGRGVTEIGVISLGFTLVRLALHTVVASARFCAVQGIHTHELSDFEKVGNAIRLLESLVQLFICSDDFEIVPELLPKLRYASEGFSQPASERAMPQLSHIILPSSRWNESGLRFPFTAISALNRFLTSALFSTNAGCETSIGSSAVEAM